MVDNHARNLEKIGKNSEKQFEERVKTHPQMHCLRAHLEIKMFMELINFQHSKISAKHCNFGLLSQVPLAPIKAKSIRLKITHIYRVSQKKCSHV